MYETELDRANRLPRRPMSLKGTPPPQFLTFRNPFSVPMYIRAEMDHHGRTTWYFRELESEPSAGT